MRGLGRPAPRGRVLDELDGISLRIEEGREPGVAFDVSFVHEPDASARELGLSPVEVTDLEHRSGPAATDGLAVSRRMQRKATTSGVELCPRRAVLAEE